MVEMEPKAQPEMRELAKENPADEAFESLLEEAARAGRPDEHVFRETLAFIVAKRPFAPWEVHHRQHWRFPLAAVLGVFGASSLLGFAPLWRLEPATALSFWSDALLAATVRPLGALWSARALLGEASEVLRPTSAGASLVLAVLLGLAVMGAGALGFMLRRPRLADASR